MNADGELMENILAIIDYELLCNSTLESLEIKRFQYTRISRFKTIEILYKKLLMIVINYRISFLSLRF